MVLCLFNQMLSAVISVIEMAASNAGSSGTLARLTHDSEARIQQNWTYLLTELDAKDIIDSLFENGDITLDQMQDIDSKPTPRKRTEAMLKLIISKKKQKAYNTFRKALEKDYEHVIEQLDSTQVEPAQDEQPPYAWFSDVPESKRQLPLKQRDASSFSNCFGNGWEALMYQLGIRRTELELELQNVGFIKKIAISNLIIRWTQKIGRQATLQRFMDAVISVSSGDTVTIDWELLKTCVDRIG